MRKPNGRNASRSISIDPEALDEVIRHAFRLAWAHEDFVDYGCANPPRVAPSPQMKRAAARHRARWAAATPAVRAAAVFYLGVERVELRPGCCPVKVLGVPVAVERFSPDTAALVLAWGGGNWLRLDRQTVKYRLASYGPRLRRLGYNVGAITKRLTWACLALGQTPEPTLAQQLLSVKCNGEVFLCEKIRETTRRLPAEIIAGAVQVGRRHACEDDGATRAAFREGVLVELKRRLGTRHAAFAVDCACALLLGTAEPSGHERLAIQAAAEGAA